MMFFKNSFLSIIICNIYGSLNWDFVALVTSFVPFPASEVFEGLLEANLLESIR